MPIRPAVRCLAATLVSLACTASAWGQGQALEPRLEGRALVDALVQGGNIVLMRHASTGDFVPTDGSVVLDDCSTQRNLSDAGRAQAKAMGQAFERLGIRVSRVDSSPYCRCLETGRLAFGMAEKSDLLSVGDDLSGGEKDEMGRMIRERLNQAPEPGTNAVFITHTGNLLYSFGLGTRPEGIVHVFKPAEFGPSVYQGKLVPSDWQALSGASTGPTTEGTAAPVAPTSP